MNLLYSQIVGKPIGALAEKAKIGMIKDIVINPENSVALGVIVGQGILSWGSRVIDWRDMRAFDSRGAVISTVENVLSIGEIVRVQELVKQGFNLIGLPVVTTAGARLGLVRDYEIDWESGMLVKIYVKGAWGPKRIIGQSAISRIDLDRVIIRNGEMKKRILASKTCAESV